MARNTNKRGLVAPPHAAALNALDFASSMQAWERAVALLEGTDFRNDDAAVYAATQAETRLADVVIGTPAPTPQQAADKVRVLWRRWSGRAGDLKNPADRIKEASAPYDGPYTESDFSRSLMALYLDLTPGEPVYAVGDAFADEVAAVLEMERRIDNNTSLADYQAWEGRCFAAIDVADALPAAPENLGSKIRALRLVYEHNGGFDQMDNETSDARLLRDIAKTLLTMGIGV